VTIARTTLRRFPAEFSALLTRKGRTLAAGTSEARPFFASAGLIDQGWAAVAFDLLERDLKPALKPLARPIPPETILNQTRNYQERLPKTVRTASAALDGRTSRAARIASDIGLAAMLGSQSYFAFAERAAGRTLKRKFGRQALRYGPGDNAGPHTDHHPEEPQAKDGYFDLHLTFAGGGAKRQLLVYATGGHFDAAVDIAVAGGITAYRLPFWHYTTPLEGPDTAARWVILGTFLYA
jgi:hypothetical protein